MPPKRASTGAAAESSSKKARPATNDPDNGDKPDVLEWPRDPSWAPVSGSANADMNYKITIFNPPFCWAGTPQMLAAARSCQPAANQSAVSLTNHDFDCSVTLFQQSQFQPLATTPVAISVNQIALLALNPSAVVRDLNHARAESRSRSRSIDGDREASFPATDEPHHDL